MYCEMDAIRTQLAKERKELLEEREKIANLEKELKEVKLGHNINTKR